MKPKLTRRVLKILKYLLITSVLIVVAYLLIWTVLRGYSAAWTGFGDFIKPDGEFVRRKTLWDWMQLLIIPLFLAGGAFFLNRAERSNENRIATDRRHEEALQSYLDRMADLLLKEKLLTTKNEEVRDVARIRTLTLLRRIDQTRKGIVIRFLHEAGLIRQEKPIVDLTGADLRFADLQFADLRGAGLKSTDLRSAMLNEAELCGADLRGANLRDANLRSASRIDDYRYEELRMAKTIVDYVIPGVNLENADLRGANLQDAYFENANLQLARLEDARLNGANLAYANLQGADVDDKQLKTVRLLQGAIMTDGTRHE